MKIIADTPNYFEEVGRIVHYVDELKKRRIEVVFEREGLRLTETYGKGVRTHFYSTANELRAYLHGLEDGFWHAVKVDQALFEEIPGVNLPQKKVGG